MIQIGTLLSVVPISTCVSPPIVSWAADIFNVHGYIAFITGLISGVLAPFLLVAASNLGIIEIVATEEEEASVLAPFCVLLLVALFGAPLPPMLDTTVLKILPDKSRYGEVRIWGSIGFGLFAFMTGFVIDSFGVGSNIYIYAVGISLTGIILSVAIFRSRKMQNANRYSEQDMGQQQKSRLGGNETLAALRGLLARPSAKQLFVVIFVYGFAHSVINNMVPMFLTKDLEVSGSVIGVALVLALCGEVPCFLVSQKILTMFKNGPYSVLTISHAVMAGRMVVYALAGWFHSSTLALAVQLLHGMTFSLPWASFVLIMNSIAPPGFGTTIQSILHSLFVGVAGSAGTFVGSFLYSALGASNFFLTVATVVSLSYFFILSRIPHNYSPQIISTQDFE